MYVAFWLGKATALLRVIKESLPELVCGDHTPLTGLQEYATLLAKKLANHDVLKSGRRGVIRKRSSLTKEEIELNKTVPEITIESHANIKMLVNSCIRNMASINLRQSKTHS